MSGRRGRGVYGTRRWRMVQAFILERDHYTCGSCGCYANEVHHIRPLEDGGAAFDPANLRALCRGCHFIAHRKRRPQERLEVRDRAGWRALIASLTRYSSSTAALST